MRHGIGSVRPYLHGPVSLVGFVTEVFGAKELERHAFGPEKFHVEMQIGDSVLVIEAGERPAGADAFPNAVYVYVEDVDKTYERAMRRGAQSIAAPADKPYQERQAGFRDSAGNTWWISTYQPSEARRRST
ncbi:MAG TPA: VOC family protein [Burkholderiales bacterium]